MLYLYSDIAGIIKSGEMMKHTKSYLQTLLMGVFMFILCDGAVAKETPQSPVAKQPLSQPNTNSNSAQSGEKTESSQPEKKPPLTWEEQINQSQKNWEEQQKKSVTDWQEQQKQAEENWQKQIDQQQKDWLEQSGQTSAPPARSLAPPEPGQSTPSAPDSGGTWESLY